MDLILTRISGGRLETVFGALRWADQQLPIGVTLELCWRDNLAFASCIPLGDYRIERHVGNNVGACLYVHDVPQRSDILIHRGNMEDETRGCVLLGEYFHEINGEPGVWRSGQAMDELLANPHVDDGSRLVVEAGPRYTGK